MLQRLHFLYYNTQLFLQSSSNAQMLPNSTKYCWLLHLSALHLPCSFEKKKEEIHIQNMTVKLTEELGGLGGIN